MDPAEQSDAQREDVVPCWACSTPIVVPMSDGVPAPIYACAWCGALTHTDGEASQHNRRSRLRTAIIRNAQRLIIGLLILIISSIVGPGVLVLLPELFPTTTAAYVVNMMLTGWLVINVVFNLVAATVKPAGSVDRYMAAIRSQGSKSSGEEARPPCGAYQHHSYCELCKAHKPPHAHHCSVCQTCVVAMDHHCPFLSNCVGADNHRNFLLFLFWTIISCFYVTAVASVLLLARRTYVWDFVSAVLRSLQWQRVILAWFVVLQTAPAWLSASLYLLVASLGLALGLGILMQRQVNFLLRGVSYIDALNLRTKGHTPNMVSDPVMNLRKVFGSRHPGIWLLPAWENPPLQEECKKGT